MSDCSTRASSGSFFDVVPPDILAVIVSCVAAYSSDDWHHFELFHCHSAFGEMLRQSLTDLRGHVRRTREYQNIVIAWRHPFALESQRLIDACRCLRSIQLIFGEETRWYAVQFDSLFATCGTTLEEVRISWCGVSLNSIAKSIATYCQHIYMLSIETEYEALSILPLFHAVGRTLRRLQFVCGNRQPFKEIANYCPILEKVEGLHDFCTPFLMQLKTPLQFAEFQQCPSVETLQAIIERFPTIQLAVNVSIAREDWENKLRTITERLKKLCINATYHVPQDFEHVAASMTNLEKLVLKFYGTQSLDFLYAFFAVPKPNLRHLTITHFDSKSDLPNVFDILADRVSTLRVFVFSRKRSRHDENIHFFGSTEFARFLSSNKELECLRVMYNVLDVDGVFGIQFEERTAELIRSLEKNRKLAEFSVDKFSRRRALSRSKLIANACVALRGRGIKIVGDGFTYLETSPPIRFHDCQSYAI